MLLDRLSFEKSGSFFCLLDKMFSISNAVTGSASVQTCGHLAVFIVHCNPR